MKLKKTDLNRIAKFLWQKGVENSEKYFNNNYNDLKFEIEYFCMKKEINSVSKENILQALELAKQIKK